jgi:hypothetical protein
MLSPPNLYAIKAVHGFVRLSAGQKRGFALPPERVRARRAIHGPHTNLAGKKPFAR